MVLEKTLAKIQDKIDELAPTLELFLDESVQPSVADCERLQRLLHELQDHVSVYKYHKNDKELSPSFNIHAKVSEAINTMEEAEEEVVTRIIVSTEETPMVEPTNEVVIDEVPLQEDQPSRSESLPPLTVAINDKFRFINELFRQNASEYSIAMEQLNSLANWPDSEVYLNSLKGIYGWRDDSEVFKRLGFLVKKRFG